MATKPRAAKAPSKPVAARRAASSAPEAAPKAAAKAVKPVAKAPAKAAAKTVKPVAKVASKPAPKSAAKPAVKPAAKLSVKRAATPAPAALKRAAKAVVASAVPTAGNPSLVRDSFTMPEAEYAVFASTKQRCLKAGVEIKKSELLRIGMALVGQLDVATLQAVLAGLPQLKTGRPRSE